MRAICPIRADSAAGVRTIKVDDGMGGVLGEFFGVLVLDVCDDGQGVLVPGLGQFLTDAVGRPYLLRRLIVANMEAIATHAESLDVVGSGHLGDFDVLRLAEGLVVAGERR